MLLPFILMDSLYTLALDQLGLKKTPNNIKSLQEAGQIGGLVRIDDN
jgi:hypothetical protein